MAQRSPRITLPNRDTPVSRRGFVAIGGGIATATSAGFIAMRELDNGLLHRGQDDPTATLGTALATPSPTPGTAGSPETVERVDPKDVIEEISVRELRQYLDSGAFTIAELVAACLDRIDELDGGSTDLRAMIETNPDAGAIADDLDEELERGDHRGPLHGIPVVLKDIVATDDEMRTTAGSLALADNPVTRDAFIVERLRDAGAVILGKTNLTEWSNFMGSSGQSGFSARGGQTVNPYHLDYSPSGSSSGSAAAVAASYVPLAIGSETNASIISPASTCGVVGIKPTVGLVSRAGVIPISFSQDSPGPIARSVEDAAILLGVIAGVDPDDPSQGIAESSSPASEFSRSPVPEPGEIDYTGALDADGLDGARIGLCRTLFGFDPRADAALEDAIASMEDAGAEIVDDVYIESYGTFSELGNNYTVLLTEFAWGLTEFLGTYMPNAPVGTIQEIVDFNLANAEDALGSRDQSGLTDALGAREIDDPVYEDVRATNQQLLRGDGIDTVMDELELDALVAPSAALAASLTGAGDTYYGASAEPACVAGYPSITIPIGLVDGLPAGIHFFGRAFSEETLLRLAYSLERSLPKRKPPTYIERGEPLPGD
ncbi:MAG: amidase [Chloroflexota bacterium]|nr:amidase [Chloroflexota bacterium]